MGQQYSSRYSNPEGEGRGSTATEGLDQSIQSSVSASVSEAAEAITDSDTGDEVPPPDERPSWDEYDPDESSPSVPSEDLQGPDEYQNEDLWDHSNRERGPDGRLNDDPTPPRNQRMGVSDHRMNVETPEPESPPGPDSPDVSSGEDLLSDDDVELGAGAGNELSADNHAMEDRLAAETDQNAIADEAMGPSGDYSSPEAGPNNMQGGMEFRETISEHLSENDTITNPHLETESEIEYELANVGLEDGMGTDGKVVPEKALTGPDKDTIRGDAAEYAELHRMEIGGETVPRTPGSTLSQQESIEGGKNELASQSEYAQKLADEHGDTKARVLVEQKTKMVRKGVSQDLAGGGSSVEDSGPGPSASKAQAETLFDQYPDSFGARDRVEERAAELSDKHDVSQERVKREIADTLLNEPDNQSVVHKGTRGDGETTPKLQLDDTADYTRAGDEFRDAVKGVSGDLVTAGDYIPHSGFHRVVEDSPTNQDGLRRGSIKGRVKGVVNETTAKSDGIRQVAYLEDPDNPDAPDVKLSIWESNEHTPEHWGGDMTTDFTKHSPTLEQGQVVAVDEAKVYMNRNAQNMNDGIGEPAASADRQAEISIIEDISEEESLSGNGQTAQDLTVAYPDRENGLDEDGDVDTDRVDHNGKVHLRGLGENGDISRYFNDQGDINFPDPANR
jgi:hypothetical protein